MTNQQNPSSPNAKSDNPQNSNQPASKENPANLKDPKNPNPTEAAKPAQADGNKAEVGKAHDKAPEAANKTDEKSDSYNKDAGKQGQASTKPGEKSSTTKAA